MGTSTFNRRSELAGRVSFSLPGEARDLFEQPVLGTEAIDMRLVALYSLKYVPKKPDEDYNGEKRQ